MNLCLELWFLSELSYFLYANMLKIKLKVKFRTLLVINTFGKGYSLCWQKKYGIEFTFHPEDWASNKMNAVIISCDVGGLQKRY